MSKLDDAIIDRLSKQVDCLRTACERVSSYWINDPRAPYGGLCDTLNQALKDTKPFTLSVCVNCGRVYEYHGGLIICEQCESTQNHNRNKGKVVKS